MIIRGPNGPLIIQVNSCVTHIRSFSVDFGTLLPTITCTFWFPFFVCVCETLLRLRTECFCQHKQDWVYELYSFPLSTCGHCTKQLTLNTKRFADRAWSRYLQKKYQIIADGVQRIVFCCYRHVTWIKISIAWNFLLPHLEVQNNYRLTWTRLAGRRPARRIIIRSHAASLPQV